MGAPRARSRLADLPRHPRSRRASRRSVVGDDEALLAEREAPEDRDGGRRSAGASSAASDDTINPKLETGEIEIVATEIRLLNDVEAAAVLDRRRRAGVRGHAPALSLSRSAPAAHAAQHRSCATADDGDPAVLRRAGLPGDRDADSDQVDARGRARLSRAEPRASGRVLRAAAVAADLQADPDDLRAWIATSRSAAASATRICAPTVSPSSRRSTSRSRSPPRRWCSR